MNTLTKWAPKVGSMVGWPLAAAVATTAVAALLAGCDGGGARTEGPPPPVSLVPDVPVPQGFKFVPGDSNERTSGGTRVVVHVYKGKIGAMNKVPEVTAFYENAMPANGWSIVEKDYEYGTQRLVFSKGRENCFISIWKPWMAKIMVQIYPKGGQPPVPGGGLES